MSNTSHRRALSFYNFSATLCLTYDNHVYKVSKLVAFLNVLKITIIILIAAPIAASLKESTLKFGFFDPANFSIVSRVTMFCAAITIHASNFVLTIMQILWRNHIKDFMNEALESTPSERYLKIFQKLCIKNSMASGILFVLSSFLQYFSSMHVSFASAVIYILMVDSVEVILSFVSFVRNFENFVAVLLEEFRNDIKNLVNFEKFQEGSDEANYRKLSEKYQKIYNLVEKFNEAVGLQLTMITCLWVVMLVLQVTSMAKTSFKCSYKYYSGFQWDTIHSEA